MHASFGIAEVIQNYCLHCILAGKKQSILSGKWERVNIFACFK